MKKKKNKKIWIISIATILLLVVIVSFFIFLRPIHQTSFYYDEKLGFIETEITIYNRYNQFLKIFQQAVLFAQTEAEVGDNIILTDTYVVTGLTVADTSDPNCDGICKLNILDIYINNPIGESILIKTTFPEAIDWDTITTTTSFTAIHEGTYSATTYYYEDLCNFFVLGECERSYCCQMSWLEQSDNTIIVTEPETLCTKEPYWTGWISFETISNGYIEKRVHYSVDGNCEYYEDNVEFRTFCDSGYQITGTDGNTGGAGQLTCEIMPIEPECTTDDECIGQICKNQQCVVYECNTGEVVTTDCSDNSTITTHTCTNNRLIETGNICPTNGDICDSTHLSLCLTEGECTEANGYWYNSQCNENLEDVPECTGSETKCIGESYYICKSEIFVNQGKIDEKCGYVATDDECTGTKERCEGTILYQCENSLFVNKGEVNGKCGYVITDTDDKDDDEDFNWWLVAGIAGGIIVLFIILAIIVKKIQK